MDCKCGSDGQPTNQCIERQCSMVTCPPGQWAKPVPGTCCGFNCVISPAVPPQPGLYFKFNKTLCTAICSSRTCFERPLLWTRSNLLRHLCGYLLLIFMLFYTCFERHLAFYGTFHWKCRDVAQNRFCCNWKLKHLPLGGDTNNVFCSVLYCAIREHQYHHQILRPPATCNHSVILQHNVLRQNEHVNHVTEFVLLYTYT